MRPTLTIRRADLDDIGTVTDLRAEATTWLASKGLEQWQPRPGRRGGSPTRLRDDIVRGTCYMAYAGDELVGTITVDDRADPEFWQPSERAEPAVYIHRMVVARHHAGHDLGRTLLEFADNQAARAGARWLRLDAWKDNTELHAYYVRHGFEHLRTVDLPHRGSGALFQRPVST